VAIFYHDQEKPPQVLLRALRAQLAEGDDLSEILAGIIVEVIRKMQEQEGGKPANFHLRALKEHMGRGAFEAYLARHNYAY